MDVADKVALITGAAEGLGKAFANELLKKQIKAVCILDIQEIKGKETSTEFKNKYGEDRVHFIKCDVTDAKELEGAFIEIKGRFGQLDLVCNNAGISNESKWEKMIDINLTAVIRGNFLAIKYMGTENGGSGGTIVNIASMAAMKGVFSAPVYTATKHGVVGLCQALSLNPLVESNNIRIQTLCPGWTDTSLLKCAVTYGPISARETRADKSVLQPSTVAEAFMKLVEEGVNGQVMELPAEG